MRVLFVELYAPLETFMIELESFTVDPPRVCCSRVYVKYVHV
jgi:hypothetical protein